MLIKKFEAENLEQALSMIKAELGPDALILSTNRKKRGLFRSPTVEVTAAFDKRSEAKPADGFDEKTLLDVFPHRKYDEPESQDESQDEIQVSIPKSPKRSYERVSQIGVSGIGVGTVLPVHHYEIGFVGMGVSADSAKTLSRQIVIDYPKRELVDADFLFKAKVKALASDIPCISLDQMAKNRSWLFVGTAGSGKTSVMVKVAIQLKQLGQAVQLKSLDRRKVISRTEMAAYGKLIKVPVSFDADDRPSHGVELVDSPAMPLNRRDDLERFMRLSAGRSVVLVVDSCHRLSELMRIIDKARVLQPSAICFTRADLAGQWGVIYDVLKASRIPLLAVSRGASFKTPLEYFSSIELGRWLIQGSQEAFL